MKLIKRIGFFSALILPILLVAGYYIGGLAIFIIHIFVFILVPLMDYLISKDIVNVTSTDISAETKAIFYRVVTIFWVYVQLTVLFWAFYVVSTSSHSGLEWVALITGTSLVTGGVGITVAHELGHKAEKIEQLHSKILLMTVCYMHFYIEHNRGHHVHVATPNDPATSRFGENFYSFWLRSTIGGYLNAWELEKERLRKKNINFWSMDNEMINFTIIPVVFVLVCFVIGSIFFERVVWEIPIFFFAQSFFAFSLLEVVNYLEHYGMERKLLDTGFYERVTPIHSWNASHVVSNFLLFQLQRHSDHHAFAYKRYQVLNHRPESPQLPAGYSAMIIVALFPPLWFTVMNPRLEKWKQITFAKSSIQ